MTNQMTYKEAEQYIQACGEDDGPESYQHAAEIFAAIYGRQPHADDGDQFMLWSLACDAI